CANEVATLAFPDSLSSPLDLPGYDKYGVEPSMAVKGNGGSFAFGEATRPDTHGAYITIDRSGAKVPKGIYHYTEHTSGAEAGWKLPGSGVWGASDVMLSDTTSNMDGFSVQPSILADPVNIQFLTERKVERGISGDAAPDEATALHAKAKKICRVALTAECEEALRTYYIAKTRQVSFEAMPLYRKLIELGESARASLKGRDSRSLGVLVDLPGQKPLYLGASLDNGANRDINMRLNPL
ncbi:hypothetical protein PRIPAC_84096, partial [Pristionchus pacificus]|uniref:Uncharacterized protein n=1 Tax=Pristionchus pacificus TaxID=54126 RepID=A0A2A6BSR3_PRIPA